MDLKLKMVIFQQAHQRRNYNSHEVSRIIKRIIKRRRLVSTQTLTSAEFLQWEDTVGGAQRASWLWSLHLPVKKNNLFKPPFHWRFPTVCQTIFIRLLSNWDSDRWHIPQILRIVGFNQKQWNADAESFKYLLPSNESKAEHWRWRAKEFKRLNIN